MFKKTERIQKVYNLTPDKPPKHRSEGVKVPFEKIKASKAAKARARDTALLEARLVEEEKRLTLLRQAREDLLQAVQDSDSQNEKDGIRGGAAQVIARVAKEDPAGAIALAQSIRGNAQEYNDALAGIHAQVREQRSVALQTKDELQRKPFRVGKGLGTLLAAVLTKDLASMGDSITIRHDEVDIRSPHQTLGRIKIQPEKFHQGEVLIAPDYPKFFDQLLNGLGVVVNDRAMDFWEGIVPWGKLIVATPGRDEPFAEVPVLFPARKIRKSKEKIKDLEMPPVDLPDFKSEPVASDLLHQAAKDIKEEAKSGVKINHPNDPKKPDESRRAYLQRIGGGK